MLIECRRACGCYTDGAVQMCRVYRGSSDQGDKDTRTHEALFPSEQNPPYAPFHPSVLLASSVQGAKALSHEGGLLSQSWGHHTRQTCIPRAEGKCGEVPPATQVSPAARGPKTPSSPSRAQSGDPLDTQILAPRGAAGGGSRAGWEGSTVCLPHPAH